MTCAAASYQNSIDVGESVSHMHGQRLVLHDLRPMS